MTSVPSQTEVNAAEPAEGCHLTPQSILLSKEHRARLKGQRPCCLWFTGLSGSGKSTLANLVERHLFDRGRHSYLLDGDNIRLGLNRDLGFSEADRTENIRRISEVAKLMVDAGLITIVSFISPFRSDRQQARQRFETGEFIEVFLDTPLETCEARDPKGLYRKARAGLIPSFTGISSAYEAPSSPEVHLDGSRATPDEFLSTLVSQLEARGIL